MLQFVLTASLLCLVDVFFTRQQTFLWVLGVHLFSPTSFISRKWTSYSGFLRKTITFNFTFLSFSNYFGGYVDHFYLIEHEMKDTFIQLYLLHMLTCIQKQTGKAGYERNYDNRYSFNFHHYELSIYIQQHSSSTCIRSIHLSVDTIHIRISLMGGFC